MEKPEQFHDGNGTKLLVAPPGMNVAVPIDAVAAEIKGGHVDVICRTCRNKVMGYTRKGAEEFKRKVEDSIRYWAKAHVRESPSCEI